MSKTGESKRQASPQDSVDRARAAFAYECVTAAKEALREKKSENYRGLTEKLPAMIQTNGLGATLAFLGAKGTREEKGRRGAGGGPIVDRAKPEGRLFYDLAKWLTRDPQNRSLPSFPIDADPDAGYSRATQHIVGASSLAYRRDTVEALALAAWLKRLSGALIPREKNHHDSAT